MSNSNNTSNQGKSNPVKEAISRYLTKRAAEDPQFAQVFAKPNKNLDECFNYIIGEVKKMGNAVYLPDEEVFGMAVHYYDEDEIKVSPLPKGVRVSTTPPAPEKPREATAEASNAPSRPAAKVEPKRAAQPEPAYPTLFDLAEFDQQ